MSTSFEMFKKLEQEENRKQKELKVLQENLEKAKKALQKDCPHEKMTFYGDPAGVWIAIMNVIVVDISGNYGRPIVKR